MGILGLGMAVDGGDFLYFVDNGLMGNIAFAKKICAGSII